MNHTFNDQGFIYEILTIFQHIQEIKKYKLGDPRSFRYLNQSKCFELDGVNNSHEYLATRRAMDVVGVNEKEQVIVLHLSLLNDD